MARAATLFLAVIVAWSGCQGIASAAPFGWALAGAYLVDEALDKVMREWTEAYPALRKAGELLEVAGGPYGVAAGTLAIWFADEEAGWTAVRAVAVTSALAFTLKRLTRRERPLGAHGWSELPGGRDSFPSGHAAWAFTLATVAGEAFPRWREELYVGAALVALSRVAIGRHWMSDVVAGAWLGHYVASRAVAPAPLWSWEWSF